ncbi:MAG: HAD family hydrolase [Candidatus Heimdallarchaeota archaeon]
MTRIKGIFLDFDGVLSSLIARIGWPFYHALKKVQPSITKREILTVLERVIQLYLRSEKKGLFYVPKIIFKISVLLNLKKRHILPFTVNFLILFKKNHNRIFPEEHADKVLAFITKNYQTAIVTHAEKAVIKRAQQEFSHLKDIDLIVARNDLKYTKPNPFGLNLAIKTLNLQPRETLYVGDLPHDIEAGKRAGTLTCAVVNFNAAKKEKKQLLKQFQPDFLIDHISQLPQLLKKMQL